MIPVVNEGEARVNYCFMEIESKCKLILVTSVNHVTESILHLQHDVTENILRVQDDVTESILRLQDDVIESILRLQDDVTESILRLQDDVNSLRNESC